MKSPRKRSKEKVRRTTEFSQSAKARMRSADILLNSLSAGSKNRLRQYMANLTVTRGDDTPKGRKFDNDLYLVLSEYVKEPQEFNKTVKYLRNLTCNDGMLYSRSYKVYSATEEGMMRFADKDHTSFRWNRNYQKSLEKFRQIISKWNLEVLKFTNDDDVKLAIPKDDTHSGYTYIESGMKEKGRNMDGIYDRYMKAEEQARSCGTFNRPIMTAFRTQVSGEFEDDGTFTNTAKHKTRTVCMVDLLVIIAELQFAKPIQNRMALEEWYAGGKDRVDISSIIHDYHSRRSYFASTDYSSYDQTVSSWLIEDAFDVLKCGFKSLSEDEEQLFDIVKHDFIHKDFITAHGLLHSDKGIPSGSMFTQIIGSLVNCILMSTYYYSIGEDDVYMIAMGDDNASFCRNPISITDMASYLMKNFGVIVKTDDKTMYGGPKDDCKFLSTYWTDYGPTRDIHQLIARLLYSERGREYNAEITPAHVILAFILTYRSMYSLIDVGRFRKDYPIGDQDVMKVDSHYIPGALAYIRDYTMTRMKKSFIA